MSTRLLNTDQFRQIAAQALKELAQNIKDCPKCQDPKLQRGHICGAVKLRKKAPEDYTQRAYPEGCLEGEGGRSNTPWVSGGR